MSNDLLIFYYFFENETRIYDKKQNRLREIDINIMKASYLDDYLIAYGLKTKGDGKRKYY